MARMNLQCTVLYVQGEFFCLTYLTTCLTVLPTEVMIDDEVTITVMNEHSTLVIKCVYREASFSGWAKEDTLLSSLDKRVNMSVKGDVAILKVINVTVNDSGIYTCKSVLPGVNDSVRITVKGEMLILQVP